MKRQILKTILGGLFIGFVLTIAFKLLMLLLVAGCIIRLFMVRKFFYKKNYYQTSFIPQESLGLGANPKNKNFGTSPFGNYPMEETIFLSSLKVKQ